MGIPSPEYDSVLLREHLYQATGKKFLVLPEKAREATKTFIPLRKIGLGLYEYQFGQHQEVGTTFSFMQLFLNRFIRIFLLFAELTIVSGIIYGIYRGSKYVLLNRGRQFNGVPDLENASHTIKSHHTPMPSLSGSIDSLSSSPDDSPRNVYIKTDTIPDFSGDFKYPAYGQLSRNNIQMYPFENTF